MRGCGWKVKRAPLGKSRHGLIEALNYTPRTDARQIRESFPRSTVNLLSARIDVSALDNRAGATAICEL
jgi:hypothetical protein